MTHDPRFPDEDFEDEPEEWIIAENPGAVLEVRFTSEEIREIGEEQRATGMNPIHFIHDLTLDTIRERRAKRSGQAEVAD
ncbi:MAG: hypothetical protein F4Y95_08865 [Chloroflexi bacterium]|nr:hypothetical protein [Chloroflexota bacterium]